MQNGRINVPMNVPIIGQKQEQPPQFRPQYMAVDAPTAHPVAVVVPTEHGPCPVVYGGLTKLATVAAQVMCGLLSNPAHNDDLDADVKASVDMAEALLAECARRQQQAQQETHE